MASIAASCSIPNNRLAPIDVAQPVAATHSTWETLTGVNMTFTVTRAATHTLKGDCGSDAAIELRRQAWVGPECVCRNAGLRKSGGGVTQG